MATHLSGGRLPLTVTAGAAQTLLRPYGPVTTVPLSTDRATGLWPGLGGVTRTSGAQAAIAALDQTARSGRRLIGPPAQPREARPARAPRWAGHVGQRGDAPRQRVGLASPHKAGAAIQPPPGVPVPPAVRTTLGTPAAAKAHGPQEHPETRTAGSQLALARRSVSFCVTGGRGAPWRRLPPHRARWFGRACMRQLPPGRLVHSPRVPAVDHGTYRGGIDARILCGW